MDQFLHTIRLSSKIQNLLARIMTATPRRRTAVDSQELFIQLHWQPMKYRIQYKLAILAY
jgi:hypothetical protein